MVSLVGKAWWLDPLSLNISASGRSPTHLAPEADFSLKLERNRCAKSAFTAVFLPNIATMRAGNGARDGEAKP